MRRPLKLTWRQDERLLEIGPYAKIQEAPPCVAFSLYMRDKGPSIEAKDLGLENSVATWTIRELVFSGNVQYSIKYEVRMSSVADIRLRSVGGPYRFP